MIGTNAGGIPLQIEDGVNGTLVEVDDPKGENAILQTDRSNGHRK